MFVMPMQSTTPVEDASSVRISGRPAMSRTPARASANKRAAACGDCSRLRSARGCVASDHRADTAKLTTLKPISAAGDMKANPTRGQARGRR